MGLGQTERELFIPLDREAALTAVCRAGNAIGSVLESSPMLGTAMIRTRYGLQSVKVRVAVLPEPNGCRLSIGGAGDDIWGGGARKGIDKFLRALQQQFL